MLSNVYQQVPEMASTLQASDSFTHAYRRARWRNFKAWLWQKGPEQLQVWDVSNYTTHATTKELQEIPLYKIVGSVGRQRDFARDFLPLHRGLEERWTRIWQLIHGLEGVPPIEVYEIDGYYFVLDGNHRVSVAKQLGMTSIEGYVTRLKRILS